MRSIKLLFSLLIVSMIGLQTFACTVAVISGKYTKDGRPLLWKNRDTNYINNQIMFFNDGKYEYMGLVNSGDVHGKSVWIGQNSTGFAIMNSASYNLNIGDSTKLSGLEGRIIKEALATCKTIQDFEKYLDNLPKPTRLEANFGVIDAQGGAAMYELNNKGYVKFDANDQKVILIIGFSEQTADFLKSWAKEKYADCKCNHLIMSPSKLLTLLPCLPLKKYDLALISRSFGYKSKLIWSLVHATHKIII